MANERLSRDERMNVSNLTPAQQQALRLAVPWSPSHENYTPARDGYVCYTHKTQTGDSLVQMGMVTEVGDRQYTLTEQGERWRRRLLVIPAGPIPSWEALARDLASRMEHHAFCDTHPLHEAVPEDCPSCDDRRAYRVFLAKIGKD